MIPFKPNKVEKKWGYELWLANNADEDYCGKILFIEEGKSTSMHYHENKHETFYILSGQLKVDYLEHNELHQVHRLSVICVEGQSMEMPRRQEHKLIAHEGDLTLIEISTFHKDQDSYRIDE